MENAQSTLLHTDLVCGPELWTFLVPARPGCGQATKAWDSTTFYFCMRFENLVKFLM